MDALVTDHLLLGIDTGGTYTDAVLFSETHGVVAKAKALTTRHDLSVGIAGAVLPLAMVIGLTALELLVAFLQAYVFTILTCIYLNDALHPGH